MDRHIRDGFISDIVTGAHLGPGLIYSSSDKRDGQASNFITVIFNLDWPDKNLSFAQTSLQSRLDAIGSELFRVKSFLERHLMRDLSVLDIRTGCIWVRYAIDGEVDRDVVSDAMSALMRNRQFYSVTNISAHIDGLSVDSER
jgi:hypothetical protein